MALQFTIRMDTSCNTSDAKPIIYEAMHELAAEGYLGVKGLDLPVSPTDGVIYATSTRKDDLIGVLCFRVENAQQSAKVVLIYVEPTSRRAGVFTAMWGRLLDHMADLNLLTVVVTSSVSNTATNAALNKVGAIPCFTEYEAQVQKRTP